MRHLLLNGHGIWYMLVDQKIVINYLLINLGGTLCYEDTIHLFCLCNGPDC